MELTLEQLTSAIQSVVGTRKYLPISESESILVFERKGYVHLFQGIGSKAGGSAEYIASLIAEFRTERPFNYHPELLELINGL